MRRIVGNSVSNLLCMRCCTADIQTKVFVLFVCRQFEFIYEMKKIIAQRVLKKLMNNALLELTKMIFDPNSITNEKEMQPAQA